MAARYMSTQSILRKTVSTSPSSHNLYITPKRFFSQQPTAPFDPSVHQPGLLDPFGPKSPISLSHIPSPLFRPTPTQKAAAAARAAKKTLKQNKNKNRNPTHVWVLFPLYATLLGQFYQHFILE